MQHDDVLYSNGMEGIEYTKKICYEFSVDTVDVELQYQDCNMVYENVGVFELPDARKQEYMGSVVYNVIFYG